MFCTNCGNEIQDGANFCGNCGARVSNEDVYGLDETFTSPKSKLKILESPNVFTFRDYGVEYNGRFLEYSRMTPIVYPRVNGTFEFMHIECVCRYADQFDVTFKVSKEDKLRFLFACILANQYIKRVTPLQNVMYIHLLEKYKADVKQVISNMPVRFIPTDKFPEVLDSYDVEIVEGAIISETNKNLIENYTCVLNLLNSIYAETNIITKPRRENNFIYVMQASMSDSTQDVRSVEDRCCQAIIKNEQEMNDPEFQRKCDQFWQDWEEKRQARKEARHQTFGDVAKIAIGTAIGNKFSGKDKK